MSCDTHFQRLLIEMAPGDTTVGSRPSRSGRPWSPQAMGQRIAVTRGTDPHIFLVRALADHGLSPAGVKLVLLQHADRRTARDRGDVPAQAGLDPLMAAAEVETGARLFYRKPQDNTSRRADERAVPSATRPQQLTSALAAHPEEPPVECRWTPSNRGWTQAFSAQTDGDTTSPVQVFESR